MSLFVFVMDFSADIVQWGVICCAEEVLHLAHVWHFNRRKIAGTLMEGKIVTIHYSTLYIR